MFDTFLDIQWNPSNLDTSGPEESVVISEVSLFQGVLIEGFHCIYTCTCTWKCISSSPLLVVQTPHVIESLRGERCVSVAAARNHTVFLTHR